MFKEKGEGQAGKVGRKDRKGKERGIDLQEGKEGREERNQEK